MKFGRGLFAPAAVAVAALTLAGCSFSCSIGESTATSDELNSQLRDSYESQTGIALTSIDCEEAKAEVGKEFECTATNERDVDLEIEGKITSVDESDDTFKFDWNVIRATAPGEAYSTGAKMSLERQTGRKLDSVECPERIPIKVGAEVRCTVVTGDGERLGATLTLTDLDGGFRINVDQSGPVGADTTGA